MKKLIGLTLCFIFVMSAFATTVFATTYNYDSFTDGNGYGTKTKVDENVTNLNGNTAGPYSKASTAKLEDGINEKVHVKIDMEKIKQGELFEISVALKNEANEYVSEAVVMAQKANDNEVVLTAGWAQDFKAVISESGIYTFQWEMFLKDNKTFVKFTLLNGDEVIKTTGEIDFDTIVTNDTKNPIAEEEGVSVKYLWFCNIQVENGVDVYAELPILTPTDDEIKGPEDDEKEDAVEEKKEPAVEEKKETAEKDNTPKTGSIDVVLYASVIVATISLAGIVLAKKHTQNN